MPARRRLRAVMGLMIDRPLTPPHIRGDTSQSNPAWFFNIMYVIGLYGQPVQRRPYPAARPQRPITFVMLSRMRALIRVSAEFGGPYRADLLAHRRPQFRFRVHTHSPELGV